MYKVRCIRPGYCGYSSRTYFRTFNTLSQVAAFIEDFSNPVYKIENLTAKERHILWMKCLSIEKKENPSLRNIWQTKAADRYRRCVWYTYYHSSVDRAALGRREDTCLIQVGSCWSRTWPTVRWQTLGDVPVGFEVLPVIAIEGASLGKTQPTGNISYWEICKHTISYLVR